jgi:dolichol kinase
MFPNRGSVALLYRSYWAMADAAGSTTGVPGGVGHILPTSYPFSRLVHSLEELDYTAGIASTQVTHDYLQRCVLSLLTLGICASFYIKSAGVAEIKRTLAESLGVHARKIAQTASEIERKAFHLSGLFFPLLYQFCLSIGWTHAECCQVGWTMCAMTWSVDLSRLYVPFVRRNWPLKSILRDKEQSQLTGTCYFGLGCTLAVNLFSPAIACCSICFLVVGDMAAALVGRAFGGDIVVVKLGREGKKSMEGSLAMFVACNIIGNLVFYELPMREYAVCIGAFVATIVELYEPFAINDNATIPVLAGFALHWGFARMDLMCEASSATI